MCLALYSVEPKATAKGLPMPQLPITPAVSPQHSAGTGQTSVSAAEGGDGLGNAPGINFGAVLSKQLKGIASLQTSASVAEGGDGLGNEPGINFGAVLTKQLKGIASPLEKKEDAGLSLVALKESPEPAANAGAAVLPVDLSVLTASMLVPAPPAQVGGGAEIPAEADAGKPLMRLSKAGEVRLAAEIAANGKNLPQAMSPEQRFADKLAALVEAPEGNASGEIHSPDLSAAVNPPATVVVFRNPEPLPVLPVVPGVGSAEWGGAVGEKVVWMANQNHQVAELHLNPPSLGPLEVRLTISNDQASALFVSQYSAVREAIETALPQLREMLADNGIMLGNVTVGSESFSQQQASDQRNGREGSRGGLGAEGVIAQIAAPGRPVGLAREGMVDIFA